MQLIISQIDFKKSKLIQDFYFNQRIFDVCFIFSIKF
jgi:hypothetical protein